MPNTEKMHIFVGTDRSQRIGVRVLEYSIRKHTSRPFQLHSLEHLTLPQPRDLRQVQRTGFSFSRFAIPELMEFKGKAIYMDADMLVFKDIGELWDTPFDSKKILIQAGAADSKKVSLQARMSNKKKRAKQSSVSLLDCERLKWDAKQIIHGLDGEYTYAELMTDLCIVDENEIGYSIPFQWNSLEHWDASTCNIHYTDMQTQPWVCPDNKHGNLWVNTLREMLANGAVELDDVQTEVDKGFARPSLLLELQQSEEPLLAQEHSSRIQTYRQHDTQLGFEAHRAVYEAKQNREGAEKAFMAVANARESTDGISLAKDKRKDKQKDKFRLSPAKPLKILYVANAANLPTLQLAFTRPLSRLEENGCIVSDVVDELMIGAHSRSRLTRQASRRSYINKLLEQQRPDLIVFCRYSGLMAEYILQQAKQRGIRTICAIDDDLLNVPPALGEKKYAYHNDPERKHRLAYLLNHSDLVYSATPALAGQLQAYAVQAPIHTAELFCPADLRDFEGPGGIFPAVKDKVFGYMGFGHECDIAVALPGIVAALRQDEELRFELFGTIPKPAALDEFGSRVIVLPPDWDYSQFLAKLALRGWCVGLCPLADVPFNRFKVDTKWLEYSVNGTAVIASNHSVYRDALSDDCGLLVSSDADWQQALPSLLADKPYREKLVQNAQGKIRSKCNTSLFEQQFIKMIEQLELFLSLE